MEQHELFKIKRKSLKLNQEWFAERLNTTQATISRAEDGQSESMLNQCIALLLKEFPQDIKFKDFYPDYDPKRLDFLEKRVDSLENSVTELSKKIESLLAR